MKLGWTLLLVGAVMIGGYGAYTLIRFVVVTAEVPIFIRVGLPTVVVGALVLFVKVLWDRLRQRYGGEQRNYEEAQP